MRDSPCKVAAGLPRENAIGARRQVDGDALTAPRAFRIQARLGVHAGDAALTLTRLSPVDASRAKAKLDEIRAELAAGHVWAARTGLMQPCLQRLYEALKAEPPGLFHRKAPLAPEKIAETTITATAGKSTPPGGPRLELVKIIGDMRGAGMHNLSVTVADNGEAGLLTEEGRVAIFSVPAALPPEQVEAALREVGVEAGEVLELGDWKTAECGVAVAHVPFPTAG
jgi:hypothetical protein